MDLNLVVLCGKLVTEPELREYESGSTQLRMLVTVRTDTPQRRVDVLPVTMWDPKADIVEQLEGAGQRLWITARVER